MNVLKKLQHPLYLQPSFSPALILLGGVLFWTTQGQATQGVGAPMPVAVSVSAD